MILLTVIFVASILTAMLPALANSATLEWNRNSETDMNHYNVYTCPTVGCTVTKGSVNTSTGQPVVGAKPSANVVLGLGAAAVAAVDHTGNESGLSNQVRLSAPDAVAPGTPTNLIIK